MEAADAGLSRAEPSSDAESEDAYACDSNAPSVPLPSLIVLDIDGVLNTHSLASSDDDAYRWHHIDASLDLKAWLDANGIPRQAGRWIAIDDIDLARDEPELMSGHFVRTHIGAGLTEARVAEADALLLALSRARRE